ncbi:MAG: hypothetical protein WA110_01950 [Anaerolineaceae bacterium]
MSTRQIEAFVGALAGSGALAYAIHSDGSLVVVDRQGHKRTFTPPEYQHLLHPTSAPADRRKSKLGGTHDQPD